MNVIHIGLGVRGRHWLGIVRDRPDIRSVACVDPDASALDWVRAHFPDQRDTCYEKLDAALQHISVDAAIIISRADLHADQAIQALEAGLTVMTEEPIATSLAQAARVAEASRRANQPVIVAQKYDDTRSKATLQQLVHEGRVGTIAHVSCVDRRSSPTEDNFPAQTAYIQLLDVAAHHLDNMRSMLGVTPVSVMARCIKAPWSAYRHGSTTEALLEMEHNIRVQYHGSLTSNRDEHTLWIEGDRGVLWTDCSRLWWRKRGWRFFLPIRARRIPEGDALRNPRASTTTLLNQLRAAAIGRRPPETLGEDKLWTVAMVEAVMRSDKTGKAVRIGDLFREAGVTIPTSTRNPPGGRS
jgi:predicted dehydrogenase